MLNAEFLTPVGHSAFRIQHSTLFKQFREFFSQILTSQTFGHHSAVLVVEEVGRDIIYHILFADFVFAVAHLRPRSRWSTSGLRGVVPAVMRTLS